LIWLEAFNTSKLGHMMTKIECSHMRLRLSRPYLTVFQTLIMGSTEKAGPVALVWLVWPYQFLRGKNIPLRQFF